MVQKVGKSSSSSEKTSSEGSRQTETSTSSSRAVKEICENGSKTPSRVKTSSNNAFVESSTTSCVR